MKPTYTMKPEDIAAKLDPAATDREILIAAETAVKHYPVTFETIRGIYMEWNDFHNGAESLDSDTEELTMAHIARDIRTWMRWQVEYLVEKITEELRDD